MNEVRLCGRLARDPKMFEGGKQQCLSLTVATERRLPGKRVLTDFVTVKAFGKLAAFVSVYWRKGDWIMVKARLCSRPVGMGFDCDVIADSCEFVGPKPSAPASDGSAPTPWGEEDKGGDELPDGWGADPS